MVDKRKVFVFVLIGVFLFSMIGSVLAATGVSDPASVGQTAAEVTKGIGEGMVSFVSALFGSTFLGNESLSRLFMAVLLAMFIYTAFGSFFGNNPYIRWGATIAATVLAIIGLPAGFLESIRLGYGAMGATILSVIPFLVIFWFTIKIDSLLMARITWLFYSFYYLALYLSVWWTTKGWFNVYLLALIAGIIIFFFIKTIRNLMFKGELEGYTEKVSTAIKKNRVTQKLANESRRAEVEGAIS
jgi:hypothetical protein